MTIPILQYEDLQYLQCYYTEKVSLARIEKFRNFKIPSNERNWR